MAKISNRDRVRRALELLGESLDPFIAAATSDKVPADKHWTMLLAAKDVGKGAAATKKYNPVDPQNGLRMLTENITGKAIPGWFPFNEKLSRAEQSLASELRDVRDREAHHEPFSADDAYRALDTAERLLRAIGAPDAADEVKRSRIDLRRVSSEQEDRKVVRTAGAAEVGSAGLLPWREVLRPHDDVAKGNFRAAEFAADLAMVARGEGDPEYTDPVEFFRRTFLTGGLQDLITRAVKRIAGDKNASPVINLQTNFGGGKTHSMLALWHLASGRPVADYPQELQDLLGPVRLDQKIGKVALVGNHLEPSGLKPKPDGTKINTLWGELAWQLGGREAYEIVADADHTSTNPGDSLRELLAAYAPAIILIDEWVAYARQLYGRDDLAGGSFDTQFTFAQTLTEAAKAVPGALVVISIPASARDDDGHSHISEEEVGGENGREALRRLQNVVRRVADQWKAANPEESFEIVRRRLFTAPDGQALAQIGATAQAMVKFYRDHHGEFPNEATDNEYLDRIRATYPVHPELFDRLYQDWSTLERFQRTRGVLRLMNTIVGTLWRAGDTAPLIMPGSVPLREPEVMTEITQYLEDQWKAIIDADVDGVHSAPAQVDQASPDLLGKRFITQRLARTVFIGATPTLHGSHKGVDKARIFLGTALPGDVPGNFHSALNQLADKATYFYSSGSQFWFDTQANTTRTARDHAERLHPEEVWTEIIRRLQEHRSPSDQGFAAVHIAPDSSSDVPDGQEARLVIVPPSHVYDRRQGAESPAYTWSTGILDRRGSGARTHRNMLVFLAADSARYEELQASIRDLLAWKYVRDNADGVLDLTAQQKKQAEERLKRADATARDRLLGAYHWALVPTQPDPKRPLHLDAIKAEGSVGNLAERTAKRLVDKSELVLKRASAAIRLDLDSSLHTVFERDGHISLGALWDYYTTYPFLARLRDRTVLEDGVLSTLDTPIDWEGQGFALAEGWNGKDYTGLLLPTDNAPKPATVDSLLLVEPRRANQQQERDLAEAGGDEPESSGDQESQTGDDRSGTAGPSVPPRAVTTKPERRPKTRYFGTAALDPDFYGRDFGRITSEVIQHLAAVDGVELEVRLEITAVARDGFDEAKVRTVSENASTLKFEQSGFEDD
ncbi:Swt1 family HEPN domain-containing protein [Rhodococcus pyridinivorans]|uniref:Swt1 family HEPN domain-containing protein n=1 Tax=Rhodococcus pyridinivorans TaxID=103816 RepID=UPI0036810B17